VWGERRSASGDLAKAIDYYAACLDTRAIDAKGLAPLRPDLRRIDHLRDTRALADLLAHLHTVAAANPPSGLAATSTSPSSSWSPGAIRRAPSIKSRGRGPTRWASRIASTTRGPTIAR